MIFNSLSQTGRTKVCNVVYVESCSLVLVHVVFNERKTSTLDKIIVITILRIMLPSEPRRAPFKF